MESKTFIIECPCCGERLEIDSHSGKITKRWPKPEISAGEDIMQAALRKIDEEKARLDSYFASAGSNMKDREKELADLFEKEKKKIAESGDISRPENPFDLD